MKIELSHDILAKKIYDKASDDDKMLNKIHDFIQTRHEYYLDAKVLLDKNALNYIQPYLNKIVLEESEKAFIQKSKKASQRKQFWGTASVSLTLIILFISGINAAYLYYQSSSNLTAKNKQVAALNLSMQARLDAENRAKDLLNRSIELNQKELENINQAVLKQIIIQYDTLGQKQVNTRKERDLAQSSTLSDLAVEAFDQDDLKYALKLAIKAYELNENNEQAIEVLEELCDPEKALEDMTEKEQKELFRKAQKEYRAGNLKPKDMKVIFAQENSVVQEKAKGIQRTIETTKVDPKVQKEVVTPVLFKMIQEQRVLDKPILDVIPTNIAAQTTVPKPRVDCASANENLDKWIAFHQGERVIVSAKFTNKGQWYIQVKNARKGGAPLFTKIKLFAQNGQSKSISLNHLPGSPNSMSYLLRLSSEDKAFLKKEKVVAIDFDTLRQSAAVQMADKKIELPNKIQNQLLTLSQCVL